MRRWPASATRFSPDVPARPRTEARQGGQQARARIEQLGGQWTGVRHDYPGEDVALVLTDPEGHEFCIVGYL
ncbi:VOC family protein [Amycolatopsis rubida]|uniref:VOC family protein n=1 Tax=Amycolatopsis TaxID=1813 RepID=UPI000AB23A9E|nr:VOC family protein [Amycolatopsis rubida]